MSIVAVRAGLETRLNIMAGRPTDIQWELESEVFTPTVGAAYLRPWLIPAPPFNYGGTTPAKRLSGIFQIDLCWPYDDRENSAPMADALAAQFPQGLSVNANSVTTRVDRSPEIRSGRVEGDRWVIPVRVTYFANI